MGDWAGSTLLPMVDSRRPMITKLIVFRINRPLRVVALPDRSTRCLRGDISVDLETAIPRDLGGHRVYGGSAGLRRHPRSQSYGVGDPSTPPVEQRRQVNLDDRGSAR